MKVITAKSAGFCFGVQRAVSICEKAATEYKNCVTLGAIIHNEHVINELDKKGVGLISDVSEIKPDNTVIIRSHGASKAEYDSINAIGAYIIDATCPDVKRIHEIVREESQIGRLPVIIGERSHPEISAIEGWCGEHKVFETIDEFLEWLRAGDNAKKPVSFVFQTTNTKTIYDSFVEIIKKECTNNKVFDTICNATLERQQEASALAGAADVMIVIGDKNSANSMRLASICSERCKRVFFIGQARELNNVDIRETDTIGITAGASTPAWIIKEVVRKMSGEVSLDENYLEQKQEDSDVGASEVEDVVEGSETSTQDIIPQEAAENDGITTAGEAAQSVVTDDIEPAVQADDQLTKPEAALAVGLEVPPLAEPEEEPGAGPDEPPTNAGEEMLSATEATQSATPGEDLVTEPDESMSAQPDSMLYSSQSSDYSTYEPNIRDATAADDDDAASDMSASSESFEEMLEKSIKTLHTGQKVSGIVTSITATEVSVDLGTKQSGYIPIGEFTDDVNTNIDDIIKVGDPIESFVLRVNDVEGMVMLSKKRLDAIKNWDDIEAAKDSRAIVEGVVTEENKGGVVVNVKGVRVFVPASQTGLPKSSPMTELVRKSVKLRVTEVNQSRRRVVGSIRAVAVEERREKAERVWEDIETGKQYDGVVKSMTSYGVFVDIGGVDGMIHISELSWTRIKQPSEVMSVGDEVSVYVLSFDKENRKISLGYKKSEDNPWAKFTSQYSVGDIVNVKIVKMMPFGAFAEICPGVDGLIHISQITDHRIGLPSEILTDNQLVDVKITEIDMDRKKVSLSIRALIDPASQPVTDREAAEAAVADNIPVVVYDTDAPPANNEQLSNDNIQLPEEENAPDATEDTAGDREDEAAGGAADQVDSDFVDSGEAQTTETAGAESLQDDEMAVEDAEQEGSVDTDY